jgi:hypothetical protein
MMVITYQIISLLFSLAIAFKKATLFTADMDMWVWLTQKRSYDLLHAQAEMVFEINSYQCWL